jgi:Tfp pilus tip-associated adhesin PilY1
MGYSFSRVTVAKSHDTSDAPWIVIFGNGYVSTSEEASLFILNPANGKVLKRIDTQVAGCNGLSTPMAVDVDYDGVVDYVYAGDLKGNMWKFDLTSTDYNDWEVAFYESDGLTPKPLFSTPGQPITTRPDVMKHCSIYRHGYLVFFGTGKYLEATDLTDGSLQSLYGIWDYGDDGDDLENVGSWDGAALTNPELLQVPGVSLEAQSVSEYTDGSRSYRVVSSNNPDYSYTSLSGGGAQCGDYSGDSGCDLNGQGEQPDPLKRVGWRVDLPGNGERIVSDVLVRGGKLMVISYIPEGSLCGTGGTSWLMQLKACSGANLDSVLYDRNEDGLVDGQDKVSTGGGGQDVVPSGISFDGRLQPPAIIIFEQENKEMLYLSSSKGTIETQRQQSTTFGLIYWRIFRPN